MGMQMNSETIQKLAEVLPKLDETGVSISQIFFMGHDVFLKADENGAHSIQGISKRKDETSTPTMRTSTAGRATF
jgi:hypothetical protein